MVCSYTVNLHKILSLYNSTYITNKLSTQIHTRHLATFPPFSYEDLKRKLPHLLLQASTSRPPPLQAVESLHALIITNGFQFDQPIFLSNNLISAYASLGALPTSRKVFDEMPERNAVSYNSIISAYIRYDGEASEIWEVFTQMMCSGIRPTQFTFGSLLSSSSMDFIQGYQLHSAILKNGLFYSDAFSGTSLLSLFGRLGHLNEAVKLFEELPHKNLVSWNSIISSFGHHGFAEESFSMFCKLLRDGLRPSGYSLVGVLSGFGGLPYLEAGKQIHALVLKTGLEFYSSVVNSLISMHVQCSDIFFAEKLFEEMPVKDMVSWNTIIGAFAKSSNPGKALKLFLMMPLLEYIPNQTTFASILGSCATPEFLIYGELIHAKTIKNNFQSDVYVGSALVDLYAKCDCLEHAHLLFTELPLKNVTSWNALIVGYSNKDSCASFSLLRQMLLEGYRPNEYSFSILLKSSSTQNLHKLHCFILKMGYHEHKYIFGSLTASYISNGLLSDAICFTTDSNRSLSTVPSNIIAGMHNRVGQYEESKSLLFQLEEFDKVSWNTLMIACARSRDYREALRLFKDMQLARILPDNCTVVTLLSISTKLCNLALGSSIHGQLIKVDFSQCDMFVCNVLVDMYAKCGAIESSVKIFDEMTERNLISWTALISGLGIHGYASMALERFKEMESLGMKPDRVAFIAVLSACRHGGLVDEGMELFGRMKECYSIEPDMDHYICVVDLLTRYGHLKEAEQLIRGMPFQPNVVIWRNFLEACRRYNNVEGVRYVSTNPC